MPKSIKEIFFPSLSFSLIVWWPDPLEYDYDEEQGVLY